MKIASLFVLLTALFVAHANAGDGPTPSTATKDAPFVNSLGMKFVPVEIIGGLTNGKRVLFSLWDTRVQDYAEYAKAKGILPQEPKMPNFKQGPTHPVVMVNWEYAKSFCAWLTDRERTSGVIGMHDEYRLPSDHEWSCAIGIGKLEKPEENPWDKGDLNVYPWGKQWPPPPGFANYDSSLKVDQFAFTSPVGTFAPNENGLYDISGNVQQWCDDYRSYRLPGGESDLRTVRGVAWESRLWPNEINKESFLSSSRCFILETVSSLYIGFRCVLAVSPE